ncbi:hypothetical protein STAL104432_11070 [Streptomyces albus]|nr:hypothetical protein TPA0909_37980 [Streptomyces albus]
MDRAGEGSGAPVVGMACRAAGSVARSVSPSCSISSYMRLTCGPRTPEGIRMSLDLSFHQSLLAAIPKATVRGRKALAGQHT